MTQLDAFTSRLEFSLDDFQRRACEALEGGHGVLVCAPTGAGKTIVGEFAVHLALAGGTKCFYTTPIKALSNQKYADLVAVHGAESVGLLTGDSSINPDAPIVVMTTEVVRNMIYAESRALNGLSHVVMDEVHFLADRFRGAVWEEVILHLEPSVRVVSLSATVSNAEEFGDWIQTVRGDTSVIVDEHRPVPLSQHMLVGQRLFDLFDPADSTRKAGARPQVNPELKRQIRHRLLAADDERDSGRGRGRGGGPRRRDGRGPLLSRPNLVARLDREGLLPAIGFIFSRAGCDAALAQCLRSGISLLTPEQVVEVDAVVDRHLTELSPTDLDILGVQEWREGLRRGLASHHAGMLPTFRHTVEELFVRGLVRMVFATETLALGINMPARSVVLERLVKYNGESHVNLTPGEYTQLTGRAGRRGIDVEGHAVVVWTPEVNPEEVAGLAGARTFPLRSSFSPEYNMAVNLLGRLGLDGARELLHRSFAQFQADRSVVGQARKLHESQRALRKLDAELARAAQARGLEPGGTDAHGDTATAGDSVYAGFLGYITLREDIRRRERDLKYRKRIDTHDSITADLAALKRGHVIGVAVGRHRGLAVVIEPATQTQDPKPLVLTEDAWCGRIGTRDFVNPPEVLGNMRLPKNADRRTGRGRRDLASALRSTGIEVPRGRQKKRADAADDTELAGLRRTLRAHPAHQLPGGDDLFRLAERRNRLLRDIVSAERAIGERTSTLGVTFDHIVGVLSELGYLERAPEPSESTGHTMLVTESGKLLGRIYSESDLVVTECIRSGVWDDLSPADLAAVVAALVYESRRDSYGGIDALPGSTSLRTAMAATVEIWSNVTAVESRHHVSPTREPDTGFSVAVATWASGRTLGEALLLAGERGQLLSPGDFVRWNRQIVDLLEQIRLCVGTDTRLGATARAAVKAIRRGVVAAELG
ncbi:DEAD/DEAH box helicase [Gordonia jinghuaiqii]|uniref:DEAD/DEAH box helicase n=1 Tax=Gordonia jinghuaiqii TaxID=2758710 RepID=A0A7D7LNZ6_9ACTN|nr:DEAD/DEAH box helicase [Gordonia jinghuaiqii]MCR5976503.1 DEAD/DEAH box helicase [Gordonia jinghuaiqii]QMS99704.1 DEAD/DEAH box helicase [Gordonia jinghuaiqii]